MEATKDNNQFQFGGMTLNIWIEKHLQASDNTRGQTFFQDLDWLSCGER
jgi:hypothetical protein